jgi:hypothetical protein
LKVKDAQTHTHTLSNTHKMPGKSYGIQAKHCKIGAKLAKVKGSVCSLCYGMNGFYNMPVVQNAEDLRMELMENDAGWEDAMVFQIARLIEPFFRWFDNGDLQSVENLARIVRVCERTPEINHWLPTKEWGMVNDFLTDGGALPDNLALRPSGYMMNGAPPVFRGKFWRMAGIPTSTATYLDQDDNPEVVHGHMCPAHWQEGRCGDCRACWNGKEVPNVTYANQRQKIRK